MVKGFWEKLADQGRPIMALAPMANVTDAVFRRIIAKYGKPDVMWTEFVACDGLTSAGREALLIDLWYTETERPIVAQIFGSKPENFYKTAQLCRELGFDGIDINMGCPDRNVEKQGAGANLIKTPALAQEVICATQEGAGDLPVSVKTRIGYNRNTLEEWLPTLLEAHVPVITVHGRTRKEMSDVPADWSVIGRAAEIAREFVGDGERTLILGNGDIESLSQAHEAARAYSVDGVMIGRGIFGNPWLFGGEKTRDTVSVDERLSVMMEHTALFHELFAGRKHFDIMKKHYKAYVSGFDGAKELRIALMETKNFEEVVMVMQSAYPQLTYFASRG